MFAFLLSTKLKQTTVIELSEYKLLLSKIFKKSESKKKLLVTAILLIKVSQNFILLLSKINYNILLYHNGIV